MKTVTAAIVIAFTTAAASAGTPLLPPAEFDHPYSGDVQINLMDSKFVGKECRLWSGQPAPFDAAGCAWVADDDTCVVVLAGRTTKAPIADIMRHEIAHCNGWPADHPLE